MTDDPRAQTLRDEIAKLIDWCASRDRPIFRHWTKDDGEAYTPYRAIAAELRLLLAVVLPPPQEPESRIVTELNRKIDRLTTERNDLRATLEAEYSGNQALRSRYGARDDESFITFIDRLYREAPPSPAPRQTADERCKFINGRCTLCGEPESGMCGEPPEDSPALPTPREDR